jgi:MtN3 and saliva related transmembrane protein
LFNMSFIEVLGLLAGALTTFGLVPQVIHVFRLKEAHEISLPFAVMYTVGVGLWLLYGVKLGLVPLIAWNSISFVFAALLLYAKLKYGKNRYPLGPNFKR